MTIVVIEGIDGSGKDTQIEQLRPEHPFRYFKYPTPHNAKIQAYLQKKLDVGGNELVDLFLDDIYAEQEKLKAASEEGLVIVDRYVFSTIAYEAHLMGFEEIQKRVKRKRFLAPDKVILLDLPAAVSYERKKKQKALDRYEENVAYLESVRQNFLHLFREKFLCPRWVKIDAAQSVAGVQRLILKEL